MHPVYLHALYPQHKQEIHLMKAQRSRLLHPFLRLFFRRGEDFLPFQVLQIRLFGTGLIISPAVVLLAMAVGRLL